METYHKIQTLFKRDMSNKGKMIHGAWTTPELEYLKDNEWDFTEKVDGTNIRVKLRLMEDKVFVDYGGRSDNAQIPKPLVEHLEAVFPTFPMYRRDLQSPPHSQRWMHLIKWMKDAELEVVTLFGEGYGPNIQGGGKYRSDHAFVLFDVKIGDWWLKRDAVDDIADKLGIESVPALGTGTLQDAIDIVSTGITFNSGGGIVRWGAAGINGLKSAWGNFEAEGIVARPVVPLFDRKGERIITKIKAVDFK